MHNLIILFVLSLTKLLVPWKYVVAYHLLIAVRLRWPRRQKSQIPPPSHLSLSSARGSQFVTMLHKIDRRGDQSSSSFLFLPLPPLSTDVSHIWKVLTKLYRALKYFPFRLNKGENPILIVLIFVPRQAFNLLLSGDTLWHFFRHQGNPSKRVAGAICQCKKNPH